MKILPHRNKTKQLLSIFLCALFISISAIAHESAEYNSSQLPEPDQFAIQVIDETSEIIQKKHGLNPCGIGMREKFEFLEISFQAHKNLSKLEARAILHDCISIFLHNINNKKELAPYLRPFPFGYNNVAIVLFIDGEDARGVFDPEICLAKWNSDGLEFAIKSKENKFKYANIYEETHEEALAILKAQNEKTSTSK